MAKANQDHPDSATGSTSNTNQSRRKKRSKKRVLLWIAAVPVVTVVAGVVVLSTGAATGLVVPIIEKQVGLTVTKGSFVLTASGEFELRDAVLRAPDIDGLAGEIVTVDRAIISIDWGSILSGPDAVRSVTLEGPVLRVSQDTETGAVNLQSLNLSSGGGGASTPAIQIHNGVGNIS